MLENIKFQSYCWSLGTTSFRVKDLNFKIERQLQILKELWDENPEINWNGNDVIQEEYYMFAQCRCFWTFAPVFYFDIQQNKNVS